MNKQFVTYTISLGIFLLIPFCIFSQLTAIHTDSDRGFKIGLELFQKQKFGAAQKQFENISS